MEHIAILRQPFFDMILRKEKTIESRWSVNKIAPFEKVNVGDIIWLKETGKAVSASAVVDKVEFYELSLEVIETIKLKYGKQIGMDKFKNLDELKNKRYCTLIWLKDVKKIKEKEVVKSHGSGWIICSK